MKYELQMTKNTIMRTGIIFILYLIFLICDLYIFNNNLIFNDYSQKEILNFILSYLCYPVFIKYVSEKGLLFLFNMLFLTIYFTYFYLYENMSIHNNVATRYNSKKWVRDKYLFGLLTIIVISLIEYLVIYLFLREHFYMINYKYLLYPFIFKVTLMSTLYTFYNLAYTNFIFAILFVLISYLLLFKFKLYVYVIVFIVTFIFNYLFFDLKKYRYYKKWKLLK